MGSSSGENQQRTIGQAWWGRPKNPADEILSFLIWLTFAWAVYLLAFPVNPPTFPLPYIVFILYVTQLHFRLLRVPIWAADTLDLLSRTRRAIPGESSPRLLVFIAAYQAQGSIGSVLEALRLQDYPKNRFEVYVVTQESENKEKWRLFERVERNVSLALEGGIEPGTYGTEIQTLAEMLRRDSEERRDPVAGLEALAEASFLFAEGEGRIAGRIADKLIQVYFNSVDQGSDPGEFQQVLRRTGIHLSETQLDALRRCAEESLAAADRLLDDFSRILGLPPGQTVFRDPTKRARTALSLAAEGPAFLSCHGRLRRSIKKKALAFVSTTPSRAKTNVEKSARTPDWSRQLRRIYDSLQQTCPETVERAVKAIGRPGFHHICRRKEGGGKPESLNTAYFRILGERPSILGDGCNVVVIDADSLLHASSLSTIAAEIEADQDRNVIRQVAPLSTSNYAGNNVFVKMICCLDTMGSMGKWARNTRALARPDLPAGSGLVVPATLLDYLRRTKGTPWEAKTITEDARLVITDFGLMDGASRKTKFVPIHMLEAVPEARRIWDVLKQYWAQRMRWASGGPEEFIQILGAFRDDRVYAKSNREGAIEASRPGPWARAWIRAKQLRLLAGWSIDHAWWGIGYGTAPLVWLTFAFFYITPLSLKILGLCLLVGTPAFVIFGVFRRFSSHVPGGLTMPGLLRLFAGTLVFAWFHTWPIIYTQFLYLIGRRNRFKTWTTTAKPSF